MKSCILTDVVRLSFKSKRCCHYSCRKNRTEIFNELPQFREMFYKRLELLKSISAGK